MSKRNTVISTTIDHLIEQTATRGYRGFRYIHQLNDYPCFCFHVETESRIWTDAPYGVLKASLRGYTHTETLDGVESYARTIERAVQSLSEEHRELILDARVLSVRTDEGLMLPYGIVDMQIEVLYIVKHTDTITADTTRFTADLTTITADRGL